ncbi:hypothetical protein CesoFtcFv8_022475 [Champsocephalus esox]|uniref:Uncharacterized protein n=1 Tax=Champsocephalus esox TaxID=159716 RepID=A0AAN8BAY5_9TELE|nr:hypothetical protein CesoFtcFv8_022475 [Champsocephalus esox]
MAEPLYGQRGTGTAGASFHCFIPHTVSIFSIRKKDDNVFIRTDITNEPCLGCGWKASPLLSSSFGSGSGRFISSIFRNECRVGVFSQGCLSSHINEGAFADTERVVVDEERRMSLQHCSGVASRLSGRRVHSE